MKGVILAAGMAKRLRPLTDDRPKCLLAIAGKTLLERTIDAMCSAGVDSLLVVLGYRGEMIVDFIKEHYPHLPTDYLDNVDYANNNNIFSLWMAVSHLVKEEFLLMDSDIFCDPMAVKCVAQMPGDSLALNRHQLGEEEMKVVVDGNGKIVEISKTCDIDKALGESVGIEKITAPYCVALHEELKQMIEVEGLVNSFYELAFERLIPKGFSFQVVDTTSYFSYELDTVEDFEFVNSQFKS